MDIEIRPVGPERFDEAMRVLAASFSEEIKGEELEDERPVFERGRNLAAFDGESIVGHAAAYPMEITVPGGMLPVGGITSVGVLPTHRRRGIGRALMRRQLDELHENGTPLAYLWASESVIYQRYGYGLGSLTAAFDIRRQGTAFLRPVKTRGRMRLVDRAEALKLYPGVYERVRPNRPGMLDRDDAWWNVRLRDSARDRGEGSSPHFHAVYETEDGLDGYAMYRVKEGWGHANGPDHVMDVEELMSTTLDAYVALWRYCFEVDLVRRVRGWKRPVDEPLLHMLAEPRALGWQVRDGTWLRIVDVPAALEGRRFGQTNRVRLDLRDEFCPWNNGRWELEGGPDGATCRRTEEEPDLELEASDLAAMYLDAVSATALARAGRVVERSPGTLKRADAMFASDLAPWCPHIF